jgi:hypothetical protein
MEPSVLACGSSCMPSRLCMARLQLLENMHDRHSSIVSLRPASTVVTLPHSSTQRQPCLHTLVSTSFLYDTPSHCSVWQHLGCSPGQFCMLHPVLCLNCIFDIQCFLQIRMESANHAPVETHCALRFVQFSMDRDIACRAIRK